MGAFLSRTLWRELDNLLQSAAGFPPTIRGHAAFLDEVNAKTFNWTVFIVAATGFLTDSYNLFASNVILPAIAFVYWAEHGSTFAFVFNMVTLSASAIGQVAFGFLADMYGRKALYGIELMIVVISTFGLLQSSTGFTNPTDEANHTWSFTAWLFFWRILMGFGIGAEYPLSACIAAEWSSTQSRGRMMSAVFLMQPIGQLCAYGAGLTALAIFPGDSKVAMDKFWRYVIGVGVIPTLIAITFRMFMPESGRYEFDVIRSRHAAVAEPVGNGAVVNGGIRQRDDRVAVAKGVWGQFQWTEVWRYFSADRQRIKTFAGVCITWFLLDVAFYGLGFNSPGTLSKIWASGYDNLPPNGSAPYWLVNSDVDASSYSVTFLNGSSQTLTANSLFPKGVFATPLIREVLEQNIKHSIYTTSIASICGCILMIVLVNRVFRKQILIATFILLSAVLFAAFGSFTSLFHNVGSHDVLIFFWVLISVLFYFGPNTITFIIPAEVFPTEYRCTFYGIAAASGKLGAIAAQGIVYGFNRAAERATRGEGANSPNLRWSLLIFAILMLAGAFAAMLLPEVQDRRGDRRSGIPNFALEYLALTEAQKRRVLQGPMRAEDLIRARKLPHNVAMNDDIALI